MGNRSSTSEPERFYSERGAVKIVKHKQSHVCENRERHLITEGKQPSFKTARETAFKDELRTFVRIIIVIALSFVASVQNFCRISDVPVDQLYFENVLSALNFFLLTADAGNTVMILIGGHISLFLGSTTASIIWTVFFKTCLQAASSGMRFYEWFNALLHFCMYNYSHYFIEDKFNYMWQFYTLWALVFFSFACDAYCSEEIWDKWDTLSKFKYISLYLLCLTISMLLCLPYYNTGEVKHCHSAISLIVVIIFVACITLLRKTGSFD